MRSIRSRLLVTLLGLIALVVVALSWYVYTETAYALLARSRATEDLLTSQFQDRRDKYDEHLDEDLYKLAFRLALQTRARLEVDPYFRCHLFGIIPTSLSLSPYGQYAIPVWGMEVYDDRFIRQMFAKRSIDTIHFTQLENEFYQISCLGATRRSDNLTDDCLKIVDTDLQRLSLNDPVLRSSRMACGRELRFVTVRFPLFTQPVFRNYPFPRRNSRQGPSLDQRVAPVFVPTILVQVARDLNDRDKAIGEFRERLEKELATVKSQTEQAQANLLNRLIFVCMVTIVATALGVTWISRSSLKPLVQLADAVSDLSPKDLRLKIKGHEPRPEDYPEELEPIVHRLQESLASLEQAFAREKRATADISHELRTPLASLMTTAQVALRKTRTVEEYRDTLRQCVETSSHLTTLVERLLKLSRLDAGVDHVQKEPVDVVELAGQCVDMLRPLADQRNIEVELEVDDSAVALEPLVGDASKLREIFVNLIDNAVHYNKPEGHVTVRIAGEEKSVVIEVSDTGVGMAPETRANLFQRFYRADPSRQSDTVNAGLGLAIVKGYVDLIGGTIEVDSEPGVGSTFRITLPRTRAKVLVAQVA